MCRYGRMPFRMSKPSNRRLDSWKEFANYLDRDVRTVIRCAEEKGLPVRRIPDCKRQGVFADTDEIDRWMLGQAEGERPSTSEIERQAFTSSLGPQGKFPRCHRGQYFQASRSSRSGRRAPPQL